MWGDFKPVRSATESTTDRTQPKMAVLAELFTISCFIHHSDLLLNSHKPTSWFLQIKNANIEPKTIIEKLLVGLVAGAGWPPPATIYRIGASSGLWIVPGDGSTARTKFHVLPASLLA